MSAHTASALKGSKKFNNPMGGSLYPTSGQQRSSLHPPNSLSKATGVSHLSEKNGTGVSGSILYLQKQPSLNPTKKRDNKSNNDYYTIQNTRNTSIQNSSQQTSRNQHNLPPQNNSSATASKDQEEHTLKQTNDQSSSKLNLPQRRESNNGRLDKILEKSQNMMDFSKFQMNSKSEVKKYGQANTVSNRHSVLNDKCKKFILFTNLETSRALSVVKQNNIISQTSFSQISNFNKSQQSKKSVHTVSQQSVKAYNDNSTTSKSTYKKSVIEKQKEQCSPKPGAELMKNGVFRSPQHPKKTNKKLTQTGNSIFLSSSNSPMPQKSITSIQHHKNSRLNQLQPHITNSKTVVKPQSSTVGNNQTMNNPSCLQIDLSSLSSKKEDDATLIYGATVISNAQSLFQQANLSKSSQRKKSSISQNKMTPLHLISQSPQLHIGSSQMVGKSPKTYQNINSSQRHSIISTKVKQETPKIIDVQQQQHKHRTQKINKQSNKTTLLQTTAFDKKQTEERLRSREEVEADTNSQTIIEVKNVVLNSKSKTIPIKHEAKIVEDDNFSFNSQNNKSIKSIQNETLNECVSEEKSNLQHQKSALLQVASQNKLRVEKDNPRTKIIVNLSIDDCEEEVEQDYIMKEVFIEKNQSSMFQYEIDEVTALKEGKIYFSGNTLSDRLASYITETKNTPAEQEVQKSLDDEEGYYNVLLGDHLMYRYEILKILGKGSFAQVVSCIDHKTKQKVAVKITRNTEIDHKFASSECKLLTYLMENDPNDSHNIVRMIDAFYFRDHHCFVFELLNSDLFEHLKDNGFIGFDTNKIRDYAIQIIEALMFLEKHTIIHCDLKPENILLRDDKCKKLKLVDYGSGCFRSDQVYTYVQSRFYRAPEVILRIPYSEKVDIWSFGCILAELYTGEPLFPGNNEQEQLELIMEICGIPSEQVIDKSRKKDHYFDVDYSPFLIEDEELGILRIPESRKLEDAVPCQDLQFLDFLTKCLDLDPESRFTATQAYQHPWIQESLIKMKQNLQNPQIISNNKQYHGQSITSHQSSMMLLQPPMQRRREEEQDGVKGNIYEESPQRPINDKPTKSLVQHFNFQTVKINQTQDNDSMASTPKNEGGIVQHNGKQQDLDLKFQNMVNNEQVKNEEQVNKPHGNLNSRQSIPPKEQDKPKSIKMIGKYEIIRSDEEVRDSNSRTSGIASEANIPPVNQHDAINNENTINKITITFYQKRTHNKK